ncbi:gibberellin-regulated protein 9-like [Corylus avellana]|uniref:gibberellin-regulated protein 9-like n=1 Tax=Corylus avellana TaxID=13451 RepID=UPI00286A0BDD|nr:gibberellin-regulated protein 9-like [Corylus avellana]
MKLLSGFVIAILLLQALAEASSINKAANALATVDEGSNVIAPDSKHHLPKKINCSSACSRRCKEASRKKRCTRACKSCCMRCHCVPPGTYGHKNACPCYARLKTHGNKLKCP